MPPDTVIPRPWRVDNSVREGFEIAFDGGFDLEYMPTAIAWERGNDVYLLDDGSRYLFWFVICNKLWRILYPTQLHKIMEAWTFGGELKFEEIEDSLIDCMDGDLGKLLTVVRTK